MSEYGRRLMVESGFETVVGEVSRAIREEGLQTIARIDVRDHFWRDLAHNFRQYVLIEAWSSQLALEALQRDLDVGTILYATFAVYELTDGHTVVVAREPFSALTANPDWRRAAPELAAIADREIERFARVLARLQQHSASHASGLPAT
jgi:uncharacterized protein (DUF302 family)